MYPLMKTAGIAILAALVMTVFAVCGADAQGVKDQIVGTWSVVSVVNEAGGKKMELFGTNPQGQFIFTADGHFSTNIVRPGRTKFASRDRMKGSSEEYKEAVQGNIGTFGTYTISADGTIEAHIIGSSFPNWDGTTQKRHVEINGDEMKYTNPTPSTGQNAVLTLKRAK